LGEIGPLLDKPRGGGKRSGMHAFIANQAMCETPP
jgi:hypothetical protein